MAIIIENQSKCPLCGDVLNRNKEYLLVPPLISNVNDDLFFLSDSGIHIDCLNHNPLKEKLLYHIDMYDKKLSLARSMVDGKLITNPGDLLSFGLLTSNEREKLYKFNYLLLNKKDIDKWNDKNEFISVAQRFIQEGKWKSLTDFHYLNYLINELKHNER